MADTSKQALSGLKAAKDIVTQKATVAKLKHQLGSLKRAIGKAACEQGIDCGEASRKVAAAVAAVEKANRRSAEVAEAMKRSGGIKDKAIAAKDVATAKAAQATSEMRLNSAYDAVGDYVVAHGIVVPGMENETAQASELQRHIESLHQQISELGSGLLKNKVGLAAVACVVLLACGLGWYVVGNMVGGSQTSVRESPSNVRYSSTSASTQDAGGSWKKRANEEKQKLPGILKKCVALADTDPDGAAELLGMQMVSLSDEEALAEAMADMPKEDQKKLAEIKRRAKEIWQKRGAEAGVANEDFQANGGWSQFDPSKEKASPTASESESTKGSNSKAFQSYKQGWEIGVQMANNKLNHFNAVPDQAKDDVRDECRQMVAERRRARDELKSHPAYGQDHPEYIKAAGIHDGMQKTFEKAGAI